METPLGMVPTMQALRQLVVEKGVRPDRPNVQEAPQLTPAIWKVARQCWAKDPAGRPTALVVAQKLGSLPLPNRPIILEPPPVEEVQVEAIDVARPPQPVLRRKPSMVQRLLHRRSASESNLRPPMPPMPELPTLSNKPASQSFSLRRRASRMPIVEEESEKRSPSPEPSLSTTPPFAFTKAHKRCLTLNNDRNTSVLSLSDGGRYLAVGLEIDHVILWEIHKGTRCKPPRMRNGSHGPFVTRNADLYDRPTDPIIALDLRDTFHGRFLVSVTRMRICASECINIGRNSGTQWEGRQGFGSPSYLGVQFQGGGFCDSVAVIDAQHQLRRAPKSAVGRGASRHYLLAAVNPNERTTFLWPRGSKKIFMSVPGGDIVICNSQDGQEVSRPLVFGDAQLERMGVPVAVQGRSREPSDHPVTSQDGRADEPTDAFGRSQQISVECESMAYHPTDKKLVACYNNGEVRVWDLAKRTYQVLREPQKDAASIRTNLFAVACSPNEPFVVYPELTEDKTLIFQDINTRRQLTTFYLADSPPNRIKSIIVSPDRTKRRIVVSFEDCPTVKVWCW